MVYQLNVDDDGNVILESGKIVGAYRAVRVKPDGSIVTEFTFQDDFIIRQLALNKKVSMSIGGRSVEEIVESTTPIVAEKIPAFEAPYLVN